MIFEAFLAVLQLFETLCEKVKFVQKVSNYSPVPWLRVFLGKGAFFVLFLSISVFPTFLMPLISSQLGLDIFPKYFL
jgi:hypothetical protein